MLDECDQMLQYSYLYEQLLRATHVLRAVVCMGTCVKSELK